MRRVLYAFIAVVLFIAVYRTTTRTQESPAGPASVLSAAKACTPAAIKIKSMNAGFIDECRRKSCPFMKGVAVLTNGCDEAIGVQLKIVGLDGAGAPVAARDLWPASVSNIPPGDYTFSVDHFLTFDPKIKSFTLEPIRVQRWPDR